MKKDESYRQDRAMVLSFQLTVTDCSCKPVRHQFDGGDDEIPFVRYKMYSLWQSWTLLEKKWPFAIPLFYWTTFTTTIL